MNVVKYISLIAFAIVVGLASWKFERWINWKMFYSGETEQLFVQRIMDLDVRVSMLECEMRVVTNAVFRKAE